MGGVLHGGRQGSRGIRHVALIYDATRTYDVKVMTGVAAYLHGVNRYSVFIEENALKDQRLPELQSWKGDGIIADFDDPVVAKQVVRSGLPAVGFGGGYGWHKPTSSIPYFYTNNELISALAADHLLERGFVHLAYCGYERTPVNGWSAEREKAFVEHVASRGRLAIVFSGATEKRSWAVKQRALSVWLRRLPKPVGIMAANDARGREILEACRASDLRVPDDVAVVGVDNDELLCQLSSPPLTSVEQGAAKLGYAAAAMLEQLMSGTVPANLRFVIDPVGVVERNSTDNVAVDDQDVAAAMRFIREHAHAPIKVPDVVRAVHISRSTLENRFRAALHYTVSDAIRRAHLTRARRLILDPSLPLKQVAANSGFKTVQHMTFCFVGAFGETPAKFRVSNTRGRSYSEPSDRERF